MNAHEEIRKALRSLPWYIVGTFLFGPLVLAPFTAFASLAIYTAPYAVFESNGSTGYHMVALAAMILPGLFLWVLRQFVRAAVFTYSRNRVY